MKLPKISIVIPAYNKAEYIRETLNSIVSQNYSNLEVIIQDNVSTDGTVEIIKQFASKYPKVIFWESKKDKGQLDAINKGLSKATGEVLTYINADDVYKKGALLKVGKYFAEHPEILWVAGKGEMIDKKGRVVFSPITSYKNFLLFLNKYVFLLMTNYLTQSSVFLSKAAYQKFGPFTGARTGVMEYDLWLKLGKKQMPKIINKTLSSFRIYKGSLSSKEFKKILSLDEQIAEKYTQNPLILLLHYLHNIGRVSILTITGIQ